MLRLLSPETASDNEVVFACHGKGVRHEHREDHIKAWAEVMYESCLDYWPIAEEQLRRALGLIGWIRRLHPAEADRLAEMLTSGRTART